VAAAALQNKGFEYASLMYNNQGQENSGYVTDKYLADLAGSVKGLDVAKWKADQHSSAANALLAHAQSASQSAQVNSTPTFMVGKAGQPLTQLQVTALTPQAFYGKLDSLTQ
jgi:predicted DsbA family dithiol-disulfide isomerase